MAQHIPGIAVLTFQYQDRCTEVMAGDNVDTLSSTVHLGIVRNTSGQTDIKGKISLGRKTANSLMGAGLHGGSGLKPT